MAKFYYGGQAVIEGVMMRGRKYLSIAVRQPDGNISLRNEPLSQIYTGRLRELPFSRGVIVLIETMVLGIRALFYSASVALGEGKQEQEKVTSAALWGSLGLGLVIAIGLFLALPLIIIRFVDPYISSVMSNTYEGLIRLAFFIAYLEVISLMPDIRRVFAYHGAEHKTINAYEAGEPLEVGSVKKYSTAHTRCGTSFLLVVMVVALVTFIFLGRPVLWLRLLERIVLLPVIAAVSYEVIRLGAARAHSRAMRIFLSPGLLLQSMTTRQPEDRQIEVAISALQGVLAADTEAPKETAPVPSVADGANGINLQ